MCVESLVHTLKRNTPRRTECSRTIGVTFGDDRPYCPERFIYSLYIENRCEDDSQKSVGVFLNMSLNFCSTR
jgi:hypothetical protein